MPKGVPNKIVDNNPEQEEPANTRPDPSAEDAPLNVNQVEPIARRVAKESGGETGFGPLSKFTPPEERR